VSRKSTPRQEASDATRRRILEAVVETVVETGYYRASSNEIAKRAGVTWGAIQHLFGSREELMLAVVLDFGAQLRDQVARAEIHGETLDTRLAEVVNVLATYYENPAYLVQVQILLDLSANPKTSASSRAAVRRTVARQTQVVSRVLWGKALGPSATPELVANVASMLHGHFAGRALAGVISKPVPAARAHRFIVDALALAVREEAARLRLPLDVGSG
jgi:AcrR family transcriptional regulator